MKTSLIIGITLVILVACGDSTKEEEETSSAVETSTPTKETSGETVQPEENSTNTKITLPEGYSELSLGNNIEVALNANEKKLFAITPDTDMTLRFFLYAKSALVSTKISTSTSFEAPLREGRTPAGAGTMNLYYNATAGQPVYVEATEILGSGGTLRIAASKETCVSNPQAKFSTEIVAQNTFDYIIPPGLITSDQIKPHSYFRSDSRPTGGGEVYAPADLEFTGGTHYSHDATTNVYIFNARISCEVQVWIDHIYNPPEEIARHFSADPVSSTGQDTLDEKFSVKAGELIGYMQPYNDENGNVTDWGFDFGLLNTTKINKLSNPSRHAEKSTYSDCPYDYFPDSIKSSYTEKFGDSKNNLVPGFCRSSNQDVPGSIRGSWYKETDPDETYNKTIFIGTNVQQNNIIFASIGGSQRSVDDSMNSFKLPANVTTSHCYSNTSGYFIYFNIIDSETLQIFFDETTSNCPDSFPASGYEVYKR